ncbi:PQQ-binding-like beta-propeller repeat protein [Streptomyces diastatochromogenes]|nr:PQQ-binding-like beta-propeller repeat protein [Streptomyces diastatochromogenes]
MGGRRLRRARRQAALADGARRIARQPRQGPPRSLAAGGLYAGGGRLTAVDTVTGKVRWRFGEERAKANDGRSYYGIPAVQDGVVYVASLATMTRGISGFYDIVAVRASDGRELWTYHIGAGAKTEPRRSCTTEPSSTTPARSRSRCSPST